MYDKRGFIVHGCVVQRNYNGRYHWCTSCLIRSWESLRSWIWKMRLTMIVHISRSLMHYHSADICRFQFCKHSVPEKMLVWLGRCLKWPVIMWCVGRNPTQSNTVFVVIWLLGVQRWQSHRRSGLATLPSVGVTPYYCRLGDLLCFVFIVWFLCVLYVPSVLWCCWLGLMTCKNCLPYNLYCVGGDVKHCSIQSKSFDCFFCGVYPEQRRYRALHSIVWVSRSLT